MDPVFAIIATIIGMGVSAWNAPVDSGSVVVPYEEKAPDTAQTPKVAIETAPEELPEGEKPSQERVFLAEPQTPTGKFTTAGEVKMILEATKPNWVALRDYNGQDLMYLTHLLSWRCGLLQVQYSLNDGPLEEWPLPPCLEDTATPNAITPEHGLPYAEFPPGSIETVRIEILYDDLSRDSASFTRADVMMP